MEGRLKACTLKRDVSAQQHPASLTDSPNRQGEGCDAAETLGLGMDFSLSPVKELDWEGCFALKIP
jgi:hypothetical protein